MSENAMKEDAKSNYMKVVAKIKKYTGIDTISVSVLPGEFIVDDTSKPECLCHLYNHYNAPHVAKGSLVDIGLEYVDLESVGVLEPLFKAPVLNQQTVEVPATRNSPINIEHMMQELPKYTLKGDE